MRESIPIKNQFLKKDGLILSRIPDFYNFGNNTFELLIKKHPDFLNQFPSHLLGMSDKFSMANIIYKFIALLTINRPALKLAEYLVSTYHNFSPS